MIQCKTVRFDESLSKASDIQIFYSFHDSPFGKCLIGLLEDNKDKEKAVCHLSFAECDKESLQSLKTKYPGAKLIEETKETKKIVQQIFNDDPNATHCIKVMLKGTDFQVKVWESIINIPTGTLQTYEQVAKSIDNPKATRAVGGALKANQVGYLIPCHRVVCKSGCNKFSWGAKVKINMQEYEKSIVKNED